MTGSSRTARDWRRAECGGEGGAIGKEDPEEGVEEGEMGELGVLHSAIVALRWAAQYCSGYSAGTRGLSQAMESVAVAYTLLTGAGLRCSTSVRGSALHGALDFVPPSMALTPLAALGTGQPPTLLGLFSSVCMAPTAVLGLRPFLLSSYQPG